jgi:hypothetical protein
VCTSFGQSAVKPQGRDSSAAHGHPARRWRKLEANDLGGLAAFAVDVGRHENDPTRQLLPERAFNGAAGHTDYDGLNGQYLPV